MTKTLALLRREDGQDLTEYALLAGFLSIAAVVVLQAIGPLVAALWDTIRTAIS